MIILGVLTLRSVPLARKSSSAALEQTLWMASPGFMAADVAVSDDGDCLGLWDWVSGLWCGGTSAAGGSSCDGGGGEEAASGDLLCRFRSIAVD